jgi:hypothetical protein
VPVTRSWPSAQIAGEDVSAQPAVLEFRIGSVRP